MNLSVGRIIHVRRPNIDSACIAAIVTEVGDTVAKVTKFPPTGGSTTHMTTRGQVYLDNEDISWHDPRFCVYEIPVVQESMRLDQ